MGPSGRSYVIRALAAELDTCTVTAHVIGWALVEELTSEYFLPLARVYG